MEDSIKNALLLQKIEKFITIPAKAIRVEDILNLELTHIKSLNAENATILKQVLKISRIRELSSKFISNEDIIVLKALGIQPHQLNGWVIISRMIAEGKIDEVLEAQKISIVGLDNAGKTAILSILQGNTNLEMINSLSPTKGANRVILTKFDTTYQVWDMGGQDVYRMEYLENAEKYFLNASIIIYVIDIQDPPNFEKSLGYLKDILDLLKGLNENPEFLVMIHKVDPDIKENLEVRENIQFLKNKFKNLFQKNGFSYELITYSIYNWFGEGKSIYKEIRDYLTITPTQKQQETDFFITIMDKLLNTIYKVSATVEQRLQFLEKAINDLRDWVKFTGSTPTTGKPLLEKKELEKISITKDAKKLISGALEDLKSLLKLRPENKFID
ncbi:MAG: ADP-ribosylation factor-like protein [Candidatus Hodarchaeota archaeon]